MRCLFEGGPYSSDNCHWQLKSLLHLGQIVVTFRTLLHSGQNVITFRPSTRVSSKTVTEANQAQIDHSRKYHNTDHNVLCLSPQN